MRYVPGVRIRHQLYLIIHKEKNLVHDPKKQEKTSIPPSPTATYLCLFCKGKEYYAATCEAKRKVDTDLRYRIVPVTNMTEIYLDLENGPNEDPEFYLAAHCHGVTTGPPKGTCTIQNDPRMCYTCLRNT